MFEGKPPIASGATGLPQSETSGEELCALDWPELVAKLAAARDLRREIASSGDVGLASFNADCAQHLASHHGKFPEELAAEATAELAEGKEQYGVNPNDLANGKGACANVDRHAENGDPANRGNT